LSNRNKCRSPSREWLLHIQWSRRGKIEIRAEKQARQHSTLVVLTLDFPSSYRLFDYSRSHSDFFSLLHPTRTYVLTRTETAFRASSFIFSFLDSNGGFLGTFPDGSCLCVEQILPATKNRLQNSYSGFYSEASLQNHQTYSGQPHRCSRRQAAWHSGISCCAGEASLGFFASRYASYSGKPFYRWFRQI